MKVWDLTPILRGQSPMLRNVSKYLKTHVEFEGSSGVVPKDYTAMNVEELAKKTRKLYTQAVKRHKEAIENLHDLMLRIDRYAADENRKTLKPKPYNIGTKVWFDKYVEEEGPPTAYGNSPTRVFGEVAKVVWAIPKWGGAETFIYSIRTPEGDIHVEEHKTIHTQ